jgi:hypothetical protein
VGFDACGDTLFAAEDTYPFVVSDDPTVIRSLAVTTDDVVSALEANERRSVGAVLRVTPPFSGRMRARLHVSGTEGSYESPEPLHVAPERFVDAVPTFPTADATEDEIRADSESTYSPELHRRRHEAAIERWRQSVRKAFVERTRIDTPDGPHEVQVRRLG